MSFSDQDRFQAGKPIKASSLNAIADSAGLLRRRRTSSGMHSMQLAGIQNDIAGTSTTVIRSGYCAGGASAFSGSTNGNGMFVFTTTNPSTYAETPITMTALVFLSKGGAVTGPFYGDFGWDRAAGFWRLLVAKC